MTAPITQKTTHHLRIHGDNILECESALKLIAASLNGGNFKLAAGPAYAPVYEFKSDSGEDFLAQLFPGYGRWKFPLDEYIASLGGTLREAPDAVITRIEAEGDKIYERPILALEFSGALPAGNNAWQRTGRALALAYAGIPYLYFTELGGQELDSERVIKAARFPNPLVPFAYAVLGLSSNSISLPVYIQSPSISQSIVEIFKDCFGDKDSVELVRGILLSTDFKDSKDRIEKKVIRIIEILSKQRKRADILKPETWQELYSQKTGLEKAQWLIKNAMPWNKKTGIKTLTSTFKQLLKITYQNGAVAIGSKEMPICIIPDEKRPSFAAQVKLIYKKKVNSNFQNWLSNNTRPLLCVWIAGFKPRGDDSRPDRGLVPLARMIFGLEDMDLLTIVYGPAKESTWVQLEKDMWRLAKMNGLWEAIINLSNGILIDSNTSLQLKTQGFLVEKSKIVFEKKLLPAASEIPLFGEHDVDSVLHLLFSRGISLGVYEAMCNPPGGDWSGISILDFQKSVEFRWTSLPRVSGLTSKRPDHLIEFKTDKILLSIESKDTAARLEDKIGPRLTSYVKLLLDKKPIAFRKQNDANWQQYKDKKIEQFTLLSGAAFKFEGAENLYKTLARGKVDIVFGIEFMPASKNTIIHLVHRKEISGIVSEIKKLADKFSELLTLQIHRKS